MKKFGPTLVSNIDPQSSQIITIENTIHDSIRHRKQNNQLPGSIGQEPVAFVAADLQPELGGCVDAELQPSLGGCRSVAVAATGLQPELVDCGPAAGLQPSLIVCEPVVGLQPMNSDLEELPGLLHLGSDLEELPDMASVLRSFGLVVENFRAVDLKNYDFKQFYLSGANELSISQRVKLFRRNTTTTSLGSS